MNGRVSLQIIVFTLALTAIGRADTPFFEGFDTPRLSKDPSGAEGWSFFSGDGRATVDMTAGEEGHATILVDATRDVHGIWWALIKRRVSERMDLDLLSQPGQELRVEARIRVSHAPRRVNLHVNTQRTTDFHSHLMEFDIPDTEGWHTISMTTHGFPARPGDTVYAQLALMDWGLERYRVDIDYFRVDVVNGARAGPDRGAQVPYHPPIPEPDTFRHQIRVAEDAIIDLDNPEVNLSSWSVQDEAARKYLLTVNGTLWVILRFDLRDLAGTRVADHGLLELTTHSVLRMTDEVKDYGIVRIVEILDGDPEWRRDTVTANSLCQGLPLERVLNPQMIIDWRVTEGDGGVTHFTISKPVLQRLIDGRTLGLAIKPLGSINASFYAMENQAGRLGGRLLFNVDD
jgi:hypothetical protein